MAANGLYEISQVKTWISSRIEETARWRKAKTTEYPDDNRNERSSDALEDAAKYARRCDGEESQGLARLARCVEVASESGIDLLAPVPAEAPLPGFATKRVARRYFFDNLPTRPDDGSHEMLLLELAEATIDDLRERLFEVEAGSPLAELLRREPAKGPIDPIVELTLEIRDLRHELSTSKLDAIAARIDDAAADAYTAHQLDGALKVTQEEQAGPIGLARAAFLYSEGHDKPSGTYFVPFLEMTDGEAFPPRFENIPKGVSDFWQALADRVTTPIARARLHDICFEGRWGHGGDHAEAAALAYLEMSAIDPYALDQTGRLFTAVGKVEWLRRSLFLARKRKDDALAETVIAAIVAAARQSLEQEDLEAGVNLGHISTLVDDGANVAELDGLLDAARTRYAGGDGHFIADTIELQLRHARLDDARVEKLRRELVETWIEHAKRHEGLVRMHFLEKAAQLAQNLAIKDLLADATAQLQNISIDDLGLVKQSVQISIPAEEVEAYLAEYTSADSWHDGPATAHPVGTERRSRLQPRVRGGHGEAGTVVVPPPSDARRR